MKERLANAITNAGWLLYIIGDLDQARAKLADAYTLFAELGDLRNLAECSYLLGDVTLATGDAEAALRYGQQALDFARQSGSVSHQAYGLRVIGEALLARHDVDGAAGALEEAQAVHSTIDDPFGRVLLLRAVALVRLAQQRHAEAASIVDRGMLLADEQAVPYLQAAMRQVVQAIERHDQRFV
jgi:tetratricopeptide (TPR) repeat protein